MTFKYLYFVPFHLYSGVHFVQVLVFLQDRIYQDIYILLSVYK